MSKYILNIKTHDSIDLHKPTYLGALGIFNVSPFRGNKSM